MCKNENTNTYGDGEIALQVEDAAIDLDVLEIMASFGTEQVFLDVLLETRFVGGKLCSPKQDKCV